MYGEELSESHQVQLQQTTDADNAVSGSCIDESSCDHFCHFSAHMAGFISQIQTPFSGNSATPFIITSESFYSLNIKPPFQPPRA
ncbi:hypothetical protein MNBD_GAMMA09-3518 [hydrothermal vent metagenome]|uniref:Uncharacterized protein n=1 Tax=hydrothermal vent metagenome TaxID=652676 RepID=A0A3B0XKF7_9ZZZZ